MKKCPKCGRIMIDEKLKSGHKWQTIWHCLCGHSEVEVEQKETNLARQEHGRDSV